MSVSILQLKSRPFGGAAASRNGENPSRERRGSGNQGITRIHEGDPPSEQGRTADAGHAHAGAAAARRQEVKPQPKVGAKTAKPASKAKKAPLVKTARKTVKPTAKTTKPSTPRSAAKPPAKKAPAKPVAKAPAKT